MLQDASIMPATKSMKEVRALGAMEHLYWLMDQKHPAHLTVTAEVKGFTKVQNWRDALDAVQRRHPILSTAINRNEEGQPALYQADAAPIPLRVVDGSVQGRWELELDREMAVPFAPEQAPLIRNVLIHKPQSAVLIMIAHHAIADGMALVFLIRDLLQVLSGGQIETLSFTSTSEELLSELPKGEEIVQASQAGAPYAEPARYREGNGLAPRVTARKLDEDLTAALKERARREGTTVQGALCAALVLAGRKTSSIWRKQSVRVISPINVRAPLGAGEACGLYLVGGMVPFQPGDSRAFWELARFAKKELSPSQTFQSLSTSLHGLEAIMFKDMDVETAAQIAAVAFARDLMVSNLGQMPYESEFGKLKLEAVWGPTALQGLEGEQNVGIATTNGAIRLLHASYSLIPHFLENTELILRAACEDTRD
ncbi:MAG TPA: condensation domain-containing protein [Edaphobacter sp.]|nr:condensation domain-containing protein [Edaphobacter sp.]